MSLKRMTVSEFADFFEFYFKNTPYTMCTERLADAKGRPGNIKYYVCNTDLDATDVYYESTEWPFGDIDFDLMAHEIIQKADSDKLDRLGLKRVTTIDDGMAGFVIVCVENADGAAFSVRVKKAQASWPKPCCQGIVTMDGYAGTLPDGSLGPIINFQIDPINYKPMNFSPYCPMAEELPVTELSEDDMRFLTTTKEDRANKIDQLVSMLELNEDGHEPAATKLLHDIAYVNHVIRLIECDILSKSGK